MNIYDTAVLTRTVNSLVMQPPLFLLALLFQLEQPATAEHIYFDQERMVPRIAPFVAPHLPGKLIEDIGFDTQHFKPAYVKPKFRIDPSALIKRQMGEALTGSLTPAQRETLILNRRLTDITTQLGRREEVMVAEFLRTGSTTVSGDGFATVVVNFKRDASRTVTLLTNDRWSVNHVDSDPLLDLETMSGGSVNLGAGPTPVVVMDPLAWGLFRQRLKDRGELPPLGQFDRTSTSRFEVGPTLQEKVEYKGRVGSFDIYMYNDIYIDDAGVQRKYLPDYTVIGVGPTNLEGTRCYGWIQDLEAGFVAERFFAKSWIEKDPSARWVLGQSAPLPVPYRPNASWCLNVNG
jgi:hypothetical protein